MKAGRNNNRKRMIRITVVFEDKISPGFVIYKLAGAAKARRHKPIDLGVLSLNLCVLVPNTFNLTPVINKSN